MVARIMLRNGSRREPTNEEVNDMVEQLAGKSVPVPSVNTIIAAFENGEEVCPLFSPPYFYSATQTDLSGNRKCIRGNSNAKATKRIYSGRLPSHFQVMRRARKNPVRQQRLERGCFGRIAGGTV